MSQVVKFEKIVPEGKAMGHLQDGRAVFCIGPLPGELARVGIRKQKRHYAEAVLREIMEPAAERTGTSEDHALICSPWQDVDYGYQCKLKAEMLAESMQQHHVKLPVIGFEGAPAQAGYRNRLDFSVARVEGRLQLAFHQRGSWDNLTTLPHGCRLGHDRMNQAAQNLVEQLDTLKIGLDTAVITVRYAATTDQLLTILTTNVKAEWSRVQPDKLGNFLVARPLPGSGAPGELTYYHGDSYITEKLAGIAISYPYNSFFQTNTAAFELALARILEAAKDSHQVVELYSGVGAIGLPLAARGVAVQGVEIVPEAVEFAERNARANDIATYQAVAVAAERMDSDILKAADTVILDPPRAGLHPRVVGWLLEAKPERIIYLSCNPATQARDLALLQAHYKIASLAGFDFYPGTLHLESLAVLTLSPVATTA